MHAEQTNRALTGRNPENTHNFVGRQECGRGTRREAHRQASIMIARQVHKQTYSHIRQSHKQPGT